MNIYFVLVARENHSLCGTGWKVLISYHVSPLNLLLMIKINAPHVNVI